MALQNDIPSVRKGDWNRLKITIDKLRHIALGADSHPTYAGLVLTDLTASALVGANASKALESITVGTGLDYTRPNLTLSHLGIEALTDPGADKILFWDDTASACKWLGMGNSVAITDVTIDTIQDIRTSASPEFTGLTLTGVLSAKGGAVFNEDSADVDFRIESDDDANMFHLDANNNAIGMRIAPGITTVFGLRYPVLHIECTNSVGYAVFMERKVASDANAPIFAFANQRAAGAALGDGDIIGAINFWGWDGDEYPVSADIAAFVDGAVEDNSTPARLSFRTREEGNTDTRVVERMVIRHDGSMGLGESTPETLTEWTGIAPYLTLHNSTHEDTDGGRESRINFKGEQGVDPFEETTLARIEVGHDGAGADDKGYLDIFINDGDDDDAPIKILRVSSIGLLTDRWFGSATNTFLGIDVCGADTLEATGIYNTAIGSEVLYDITTGTANTMIGFRAGYSITSSYTNTGIGYYALRLNTGSENTGIGAFAGYNGDGSNCIFLGHRAGYYETGSSKLFIDNIARTNEADARVKALMYGVFAAAVADQTLRINADVTTAGDLDVGGELDVTSDSAFGPVSPTALTRLSISKHVTITSAGDVSYRKGIHASVQIGKTGLADYTGVVMGISTQVQLDDLNTQDWTNANAIRGFNADINTESSSAGTVTGISGMCVSANIQDAATVTNFYGYKLGTLQAFGNKLINAYGIHLSDVTAALTLNYAIYTGAGLVHFGDDVDVTGNADVTGVYKVDSTQVVSNRGAAVADAIDAATTMARLNDLLARCRAHGLIAT